LNSTLGGIALCPERRKPFDLSTEELPPEKNRGDRTPIELFVEGIQGWKGRLRRKVIDGKSYQD
jgi:hypothetical protein